MYLLLPGTFASLCGVLVLSQHITHLPLAFASFHLYSGHAQLWAQFKFLYLEKYYEESNLGVDVVAVSISGLLNTLTL
jgi:hypothetical protein